MRKLLLLLAIISLIICKKDKEKEEERDKMIPLKVGNYWTYQHWFIEEDDTTLSDTFKMEVINQKNDTFYLTGSLFTFEELTEEETTQILLYDSLYITYTDGESDTQLVLPLKEGNSWRVNEDFTAQVIGKENINIGNNNYSDCWRIEYHSEDIHKTLWFKKEIGIVKFYREEDEEITVLELKEYNIKK